MLQKQLLVLKTNRPYVENKWKLKLPERMPEKVFVECDENYQVDWETCCVFSEKLLLKQGNFKIMGEIQETSDIDKSNLGLILVLILIFFILAAFFIRPLIN